MQDQTCCATHLDKTCKLANLATSNNNNCNEWIRHFPNTLWCCVLLWLSKLPTSAIKKKKMLVGFWVNLLLFGTVQKKQEFLAWHCSKVTWVFSQLAISLLNRRLQTQCYPLLLFKTSTTIEKSRRPYIWWSSHFDRGWECWFCFFLFLPCFKCINSALHSQRELASCTQIVKWLGQKQREKLICPFFTSLWIPPVWHKIEAAVFQGPSRFSLCGRPKKQGVTFMWRRIFPARLVKPWRQHTCLLLLSPEVKRCGKKKLAACLQLNGHFFNSI